MARLRLAGRFALRRIKAVLDLLDRLTPVLILVGLFGLAYVGLSTKEQAAHTHKVQKEGEPTGVCLREAMKAGLPILTNGAAALEAGEAKAATSQARGEIELFVAFARGVEEPLAEYVILQSRRYAGVSCPAPSGPLAKLLLSTRTKEKP